MQHVTLKVVNRNGLAQIYEIEEDGTCLIGRSDTCTLQIPKTIDKEISRRHCMLYLDSSDIRIRDLGSTNGTFINDEPMESISFYDNPEEWHSHFQFLQNGDVISLGQTTIEIEIISDEFDSLGKSMESSTRRIKMTFSAQDMGMTKGRPVGEFETHNSNLNYHIF